MRHSVGCDLVAVNVIHMCCKDIFGFEATVDWMKILRHADRASFDVKVC